MQAQRTQTGRTLRVYRVTPSVKLSITDRGETTHYTVDPHKDGLTWWNWTRSKLYIVGCYCGVAVRCTCRGAEGGRTCRHIAASNKLSLLGFIDLDGPPSPTE